MLQEISDSEHAHLAASALDRQKQGSQSQPANGFSLPERKKQPNRSTTYNMFFFLMKLPRTKMQPEQLSFHPPPLQFSSQNVALAQPDHSRQTVSSQTVFIT